jgi:four helix bundle protein
MVNSPWLRKRRMGFKFEKLEVWQKAIEFGMEIHGLTRMFPKEELYILTTQIKRAGDSIALNIAEGSTGQSNAEFKKFLGYAIRSTIEVVSCLFIGRKRNLINEQDFQRLYKEAETIVKMLQALRNYLK